MWARIEPLIPKRERRPGTPGRKPLDDRKALCGILFVLYTGIQWQWLPQELGFGCGMTCRRRRRDWQESGVWEALHRVLLDELNGFGDLDLDRVVVDAAHLRSLKGGPKPVGAR